MTNEVRIWLCHQLGSREHYAIPRALYLERSLATLQTDAWVKPSIGRLLRSLKVSSLAQRYDKALGTANVRSFTPQRIAFDLRFRLQRLDKWSTILKRNEWFQDRCIPGLVEYLSNRTKAERTIVFSYSYTARRLFIESQKHGALCVLGQIDPGPFEHRWVTEQVRRDLPSFRPEEPPALYWERWREEAALADAIIVNSEWSRRGLLAEGIADEKIVTIPLVYDGPQETIASRKQHEPQSDLLRVLFLGQIIPRKGIYPLIDAFKRLHENGILVELDLVGPIGIELPNHLTPNIRWHGPVSRLEALHFYRTRDIFILPTHSDGFALTQLEALAHGMPLIASEFCGDVVVDGVNGLKLDDVSADEIMAAISKLIERPELLYTLKQNAKLPNKFRLPALANALNALAESL